MDLEQKQGKIVSFNGSWSSGIAMLTIETEQGLEHLYCDNAPTGRALNAMFDCVGQGHCIDNSKIQGKEIVFTTDEMGMLASINLPE